MTRRRVGLLVAEYLLEDPGPVPVERREYLAQVGAQIEACDAAGIELHPLPWDSDPSAEPDEFAAFVIGPAWDYAARSDDFLARLEALSRRAPLFNPLGLVRWNLSKTYLRDLAGRGVRTVPTLWRPGLDPEQLSSLVEQACDELETDTVVAKPVVGQNAWRQVRLERGATPPPAEQLPPGAVMLQPYLPSIETAGEVSLIYLGGELSHALRKLPAAGDYRIQATYGGTERVHAPAPDELEAAGAALAALDEPPLIARIDQVRDRAGAPALMELELIEPYLYPEQGPEVGERFARVLADRLG